MKFRPLQKNVLVKVFKEDQQPVTAGGIHLPTPLKRVPLEGEVIAVNTWWDDDLKRHSPPQIQVGDHILFRRRAGQYIELDGEKFLILQESDIWGVIER